MSSNDGKQQKRTGLGCGKIPSQTRVVRQGVSSLHFGLHTGGSATIDWANRVREADCTSHLIGLYYRSISV